jgi:hypothetical protein
MLFMIGKQLNRYVGLSNLKSLPSAPLQPRDADRNPALSGRSIAAQTVDESGLQAGCPARTASGAGAPLAAAGGG